MKLIGSMQEDQYRRELTASWKGISEPGSPLLAMLQQRYGVIESAFSLSWTPGQTEELFSVLINGRQVAQIIRDRSTNEVREDELCTVRQYQHQLRSPQSRIQLAVALELARSMAG